MSELFMLQYLSSLNHYFEIILNRFSVRRKTRATAIVILSVCPSVTLVIHASTVQYIEICCASHKSDVSSF